MPPGGRNLRRRIRETESIPNGINMWIRLRQHSESAALNAVQIAEILAAEYLG